MKALARSFGLALVFSLVLHASVALFVYNVISSALDRGSTPWVIKPSVVELNSAKDSSNAPKKKPEAAARPKPPGNDAAGYSASIRREVAEQFAAYREGLPAGLSCTALIRLSSVGAVLDVEIIESSGNALFDAYLVRAIRYSSPFSPPPGSILQNGIYELRMTVRT